jgi:hypothetical protein
VDEAAGALFAQRVECWLGKQSVNALGAADREAGKQVRGAGRSQRSE